jgi:hypothetical protein
VFEIVKPRTIVSGSAIAAAAALRYCTADYRLGGRSGHSPGGDYFASLYSGRLILETAARK